MIILFKFFSTPDCGIPQGVGKKFPPQKALFNGTLVKNLMKKKFPRQGPPPPEK